MIEFYNRETFTAQCRPGKAVMMTEARYMEPWSLEEAEIIEPTMTFAAKCKVGEVVVMTNASYERLKYGWCTGRTMDIDTKTKNIMKSGVQKILKSKLFYSDLLREYCNWETFNAQCRPGAVIFMTSARYGRMKYGRCIRRTMDLDTKKPTEIGCSEDIIK